MGGHEQMIVLLSISIKWIFVTLIMIYLFLFQTELLLTIQIDRVFHQMFRNYTFSATNEAGKDTAIVELVIGKMWETYLGKGNLASLRSGVQFPLVPMLWHLCSVCCWVRTSYGCVNSTLI